MPANNRVILSQKNLRPGIDPSGLCGKHESLSEKPAVEPAIHFHSSVHREEGGNWRIKENEVSRYIPAALAGNRPEILVSVAERLSELVLGRTAHHVDPPGLHVRVAGSSAGHIE